MPGLILAGARQLGQRAFLPPLADRDGFRAPPVLHPSASGLDDSGGSAVVPCCVGVVVRRPACPLPR
ncbi:MAG: hypothetical protein ACK5Q6_04540 [Cyanobacteriota bacterium]